MSNNLKLTPLGVYQGQHLRYPEENSLLNNQMFLEMLRLLRACRKLGCHLRRAYITSRLDLQVLQLTQGYLQLGSTACSNGYYNYLQELHDPISTDTSSRGVPGVHWPIKWSRTARNSGKRRDVLLYRMCVVVRKPQ